jgi:integrase
MAKTSNLRKRGSSWVAYIRIEGVQRQRSFRTRDEANLWLSRAREKKIRGDTNEFDREALAKRKTTLRDFAEQRWLPYARQRVRRRTAETYANHVRLHLVPALGDYQLGALTRELIDEFVSDWSAAGPLFQERLALARQLEEERWLRERQAVRDAEARLATREGREPRYVDVHRRSVRLGSSAGTISNGITALRAMLGCAVRWGYIVRNPSEGLDRPRGEGAEMQPLSREQVEQLLQFVSQKGYVPVLTAVSTGVRRGELFGLRWSDFDVERRRLWIRRSLDNCGEFNEPKTKRSVRAIACRPTLVQALVEHRLQSTFSADDDLIFPNVGGGPMDAANFVRREFRPVLKRAGLPLVRFHDLRHTFASLLIDRGVAPKLISEQLGHASIAITMDRYGHLFDQSYADASDAIEQAFEPSDASVLPASASAATPSPAASTQPGILVPLETGVRAAGSGTA